MAISARNLGDGVSHIVLAACIGSGGGGAVGKPHDPGKLKTWLLGGADGEQDHRASNSDGEHSGPSDVDVENARRFQ